MNELENILEKQKEFQRFINFPIDSNLESDRNELHEKYIFKLIEECIELRKECPSSMNPWSKKQKEADLTRIREELSDVFLFFVNLLATWRISIPQLIETVSSVQENNLLKVKEKKMKILNESISNIPGYTVKYGFGDMNPKKIYVGDPNKIDNDPSCYYTRIVKSELPSNRQPTVDELNFWTPIFNEELEILKIGNPSVEIVYAK